MKNLRILGLIAALSLGANMVASETPVVDQQTVVKTEVPSTVVKSKLSIFGDKFYSKMFDAKSGVQSFVTKTFTKENAKETAKSLFKSAKRGFGTLKDASAKCFTVLKSNVASVYGSFMGLIQRNPKTSAGIFAASIVTAVGGGFGLKFLLKYISKQKAEKARLQQLRSAVQKKYFEPDQEKKKKIKENKQISEKREHKKTE